MTAVRRFQQIRIKTITVKLVGLWPRLGSGGACGDYLAIMGDQNGQSVVMPSLDPVYLHKYLSVRPNAFYILSIYLLLVRLTPTHIHNNIVMIQ